MGWATFWAVFSQTHPVTLVLSDPRQPNGEPNRITLASALAKYL
jgi:hypothetical protein